MTFTYSPSVTSGRAHVLREPPTRRVVNGIRSDFALTVCGIDLDCFDAVEQSSDTPAYARHLTFCAKCAKAAK